MADLTAFVRPGRTVALLGLSGAGKPTLVNRLAGVQISATGGVRRHGGSRQTTTHRELVLLSAAGS
jgi:ribosome biogenesis GTPase